MKVKLNCIYGDKNPGDIVELKDETAKKFISSGAATESKAEDENVSAKTLKGQLTKANNKNTALEKDLQEANEKIAALEKDLQEANEKIAASVQESKEK